MEGFVYILQDDAGRFYVGSTSNLTARLKQHGRGEGFTTRRMKNPKHVLSQRFATLTEARRIEMKIKKLKRKDYIAKMVADGFIRLT